MPFLPLIMPLLAGRLAVVKALAKLKQAIKLRHLISQKVLSARLA